MRKIIVTVFASVLFLAATKAHAFTVDPNIQACKDSAPGARWEDSRPSPKCICPLATHYNLSAPDEKVRKPVFKAVDRCEFRDPAKRHVDNKPKEKAEAKTVAVAPVPPPVCSAKLGTVKSRTDEPASNDIECNGAVSQIERMSVSCNNCKPPKSKDITVAKKLKTWTETVDVKYVDSEQKSSVVTVTFFTSKSSVEAQYEVVWLSKAPPAPVDPPEKIACENSTGIWSKETQSCVCIGRTLVNGICVYKPVPLPPPAKKYVMDGTIVHPYAELLGGYGYSKSFHSDNYGLGVGAGFDASNYLRIFGGLGLELQGGTKLDADRKPVRLADGSVDKRSNSAYFIFGVQYRPIEMLGINAGVVRQMRGTTGGITNPLSVTTSGSLGASVLLPVDGATFDLGADFLVGAHQLQSFAPDAEAGFLLRVRCWFFNPRRSVEVK